MNIAEQSHTDFAPSSAQHPFSAMPNSASPISAAKSGRIGGLVLVAGLMVAAPLMAAPTLPALPDNSHALDSISESADLADSSEATNPQATLSEQLLSAKPLSEKSLSAKSLSARPLISELSPARPRRAFAYGPNALRPTSQTARVVADTAQMRGQQMRTSALQKATLVARRLEELQRENASPRLASAPPKLGLVRSTRAVPTSSKATLVASGGDAALLMPRVTTHSTAQLLPAKPSAMPAIVAPISPDAKAVTPIQFQGMKKVIKASDLSRSQLSASLTPDMKAAAVAVERLEGKTAIANNKPGAKPSTRIVQNPAAPPVRPGTPVTNSDRLSNQIEVAVSTFVVLLTTTDLQTVAVADPTIADVAVVNSRAVLLNGKANGTTSLVIVDGQKIRQYSVRVTAAPGSRPADVAAAIGIPGVTVRQLRDALVLEGEVATSEESRRAAEVAALYSPKVVNQIAIRTPDGAAGSDLAAQVRELIDNPAITVRSAGETVVLSGTVDSPAASQDAEALARIVAKNVVNQLRLPGLSVEQIRSSLGALAESPASFANSVPGQIQDFAPLVVREAGGQLILEGTVATQNELDSVAATAARSGLAVINRVSVRPAYTAEQTFMASVAAAIGRPGVIVRGTPRRLVLEGTVADTNEAVLAEQIARAFAAGGNVDNLLRTPKPLQVNVDVTIAEINSNDARNLGVQLGSATLLSETITPQGITRTINPVFNPGVIQGGNGFAGFGRSGPNNNGFIDPFRARLSFLVGDGKGRILSNPQTTVLSGRTATFQVGGQVPIPSGSTTNAAGTSSTIVFKDFGILLDIVPAVLENGTTTLRVRTEVSQPDFANGVTPPGGGSPIPGFRRRSTVTEVTVPPNGTVALSGLISSEDVRNETRVPVLSKLPIIGDLFKSKDFRNNKSELVIFVSPRVLANPLPDGQQAFAGTFAVGENSNVAAQMGNPGLSVFNGGAAIVNPGVAAQ
mgnify:CR=1 FL=1